MPDAKAAIAVAERFLHKDFNHVPLNLGIDPHDPLQELPDVDLWNEINIQNYEIISPFVSAGNMTLEVCVDFANPRIPRKIMFMLINMEQGNTLCLYKGIQDELREALAHRD